MAKIVPIVPKAAATVAPPAIESVAKEMAMNGIASDENDTTILGLIGGTAPADGEQQLDIPIFKTEEGRYLATGTEY